MLKLLHKMSSNWWQVEWKLTNFIYKIIASSKYPNNLSYDQSISTSGINYSDIIYLCLSIPLAETLQSYECNGHLLKYDNNSFGVLKHYHDYHHMIVGFMNKSFNIICSSSSMLVNKIDMKKHFLKAEILWENCLLATRLNQQWWYICPIEFKLFCLLGTTLNQQWWYIPYYPIECQLF